MRTKLKYTKIWVLLFMLVYSNMSYAQVYIKSNKDFIRVYNLENKKISKGYVQFVNDSLLGLKKGSKLEHIKIKDIGSIKTKRSAGHNVLLSAAVGGGTLGLLGAASADPDAMIFGYTAEEGLAVGFILGASGGAIGGGIKALLKNSNTYQINGDIEKLKKIW